MKRGNRQRYHPSFDIWKVLAQVNKIRRVYYKKIFNDVNFSRANNSECKISFEEILLTRPGISRKYSKLLCRY